MVEESRGRLTATGAVMKPKEDGRWVRLRDLTATLAPAPAPAQDAKVMPQLRRAVAKAQQIQPVLVLVVEKEPDYWSGGHFHEGTKSCIDPTKVWALPIGTKLYADSNHTPPVPCSGESYAG